MILCKVCDKCVSTIKHKELNGMSFVVVEQIDRKRKTTGEYLVAADPIGCGIGETVIVTMGSAARIAIANTNAPIDAAVVGIVDNDDNKNNK